MDGVKEIQISLENSSSKEKDKSSLFDINRLKPGFRILAIISTLLLSTACYIFYLNIYSPEAILMRSLANTASLHTVDFDGSIGINISAENENQSLGFIPQNYNLSSEFSGSLDIYEPEKPKLKSAVTMNLQNLFPVYIEIRLIGGKFYVNVRDIPDFGMLHPESFINQWVSYDSDFVKGIKVDRDAVIELLNDDNTIISVEKIGRAVGDQNNIEKFKVNLDPDRLFGLFGQLLKLEENDIKTINKIKDKYSHEPFEIWIDRKSRLITKVIYKFDVSELEGGFDNAKVAVDVNFKNFNMEVDVAEPSMHKPINELVGKYTK